MIKNIIRSLGIDVLPLWLISHALIMALLLGGMNCMLFLTAMTGFISYHPTDKSLIEYFPEAIAISGVLGIVLFNIYKYLFKVFSTRLSVWLFTMVVGVLICIPYIFVNIPIPVALFILWLPVTTVYEQMFFRVTSQFPVVRDKQNFKRFMEAGIIGGSVFTAFLFVLLSVWSIKLPFLITMCACMILMLLEYMLLYKRLEINETDANEEYIDSLTSFITDIPLKKTILSIISFMMLSMVAYVFIDFSFITVLGGVYSDISNLTVFLGVFYALMMLTNLLLKLFVYQNLIKTFRISKAILLSPTIIFITLFCLIVLLLLQTQSNLHNEFTIGFLLILCSRLFAYLLRESFEMSSIHLMLSAIETYTKKTISRSLAGSLLMWSLLFGGLVMLLVKSLEIHPLKPFLFLTCLTAFFWIIISYWLAHNYDATISKLILKLSSEHKSNDQEKQKNFKDRVMITTNLSGLRYLLNYQRNYQPHNFQKTFELIPDTIQSKLGLGTMDDSNNQDISSYTHNGNSSQHEPIHFYDADETNKVKIIEVLVTSPKVKDRIRAVRLIEQSMDMKYSGLLKMLIRDNEDEVKRNAIMAVSKYFNPSLIQELTEFLNHDEFADLIADVFAEIGPSAVEPLKGLFNHSDIDFNSQCRIVRILGKIGNRNSLEFLMDKLVYPNKWLVYEVVKALNEQKYKAQPVEYGILYKAIRNMVGASAWLLSMDVSLHDLNRFAPILKAIDEEYQVTMDLLFNLLQLQISEGIIDQVKSSILFNADNEQRELSVELLGSILGEEIKQYLFPLLHNNQKTEKVAQLSQHFPISCQPAVLALKEILNTDLGYVSLWTKACALKAYDEISDISESEDVIAQAFNPEPLLFEMAFCSIYKTGRDNTKDLFNRLPVKHQNHLKSILEKGKNFEFQLLFTKVISLQKISYFEKVKGHHLIPFAEILQEQFMTSGDTSYLFCSEDDVLPVFTVPFGEIALVDLHKRTFRLSKNSLYGLGLYTGGITLKATSESVIYRANPEQIGTLVLNHEELSEALYKYIQNSNFY